MICTICKETYNDKDEHCPKCFVSEENKKFFSYRGRISLKTFWRDQLFCMVLTTLFITGIKMEILIFFVFFVTAFVIGLNSFYKRFHDINKPTWIIYPVVVFIPIIGYFILLIYAGTVKGTVGQNPYGNDPLQKNDNDSKLKLTKANDEYKSKPILPENSTDMSQNNFQRIESHLSSDVWNNDPLPESQIKAISVSIGSPTLKITEAQAKELFSKANSSWSRKHKIFILNTKITQKDSGDGLTNTINAMVQSDFLSELGGSILLVQDKRIQTMNSTTGLKNNPIPIAFFTILKSNDSKKTIVMVGGKSILFG